MQWDWTVSSPNCAKQTGQQYNQKNEAGPIFYSICKINLKWINDLNVRLEIYELYRH